MTPHALLTSPRRVPRRQGADYLKRALKHPLHLVVVSWLPLFALLTGWVATALSLFLAAEVALVSIAFALPGYRRWVEQRMFAEECALASVERSRIVGQMMQPHHRELELLENLADNVRDRLVPTESSADGTDCFGVDDLLSMYARSAIAYARGRAALGERGDERIAFDIRSVAESLAAARTEQSRALTRRRLEVLRMRAVRWEKSCEELKVIAAQLALIADLVRLTCEHAGAPVPSGADDDDLERALSSMNDTEQTIGELTGLLQNATSVDPRVLRRGRLQPASTMGGVRIAADIGTAPRTAPMEVEAEGDQVSRGMRSRLSVPSS